ncbi:hypothetical protein GCM10010170_005100 [Dactylosporangium salmoneum]|uniref:DUF58 domain-containing protein n=2 Tax=Dactylosporangium salmoneum TaxID=53361 RepID=A0ABN3FEF0_9ACTN
MFAVAALELAVGAGLLALLGTDVTFAYVGGALMLSSALLFWLGMRFAMRAARARALRQRAVVGTAQVLSARQTGVSVNDQPQVALDLRVTAPGHGTYDTTVKDYVPFIALGLLSNGRPLSVRVDPLDRRQILIDWEFVHTASAPEIRQALPPEPWALAAGVPGTARVLSAEFAGSLDEQARPVYSVQLLIQVPAHPPVAAPAVLAVPLERVDAMRPGGVIPVKVDPSDPHKFAADWGVRSS